MVLLSLVVSGLLCLEACPVSAADQAKPVTDGPTWEQLQKDVKRHLKDAYLRGVPELFDKMLAVAGKLGEDDYRYTSTLRQMGEYYSDRECDLGKAQKAFRHELSIHEKVDPNFPGLAWDLYRLGQLELAANRNESAYREFQRLSRIVAQPGYNAEPSPVLALAYLMVSEVMLGDKRALAGTHKRIDALTASGSLPARARAELQVASTISGGRLRLLGDRAEPRGKELDGLMDEYLGRCEKTYQTIFKNASMPPADSTEPRKVAMDYAMTLVALGEASMARGHYKESGEYYRRAAAWRVYSGGKPEDCFYETWQGALVHGKQGKITEEYEQLKTALSMAQHGGAQGRWQEWNVLRCLSENRLRAKRKSEAKRYFDQALVALRKMGMPPAQLAVLYTQLKEFAPAGPVN